MEQIYSKIKEKWHTCVDSIVGFFYDSYSGLKTKRIIVVSSATIVAVALLIVVIRAVPYGKISTTITQGINVAIDTILPEDIATDVKNTLGTNNKETTVTYGEFHYPEIENNPTTEDKDSGFIVKDFPSKDEKDIEKETKVWKSDWVPPVLGDIQSIEGESVTKGEGKSPTVTESRYTSWSTPNELQNIVLMATEVIQDDILLQINNDIVYESWETYVLSARAALVDIPALGEQITANMTEDTVAIWSQLEKVYNTLYSDLYACESGVDLSRVAVSDTYNQAVNLTAQFMRAVAAERENVQ